MNDLRKRLLKILAVLAFSLPGLVLRTPPGFGARALPVSSPAAGPDFRRENRDLSQPLKIIVYGDMRFTDPRETRATNPKVRRWLVDQIAAENPDAVLLSGDVVWHGAEARDYAVFHAETGIWRDAHLHIYPALGNHEFGTPPGMARLPGVECGPCLENWWNAFPELRGRRWYSVQLGDSVYVLNLDSNSSLLPGSPQRAWIEAQLSGLPATVRYLFFNLHHPPVVDVQPHGDASHNGRPNEKTLADFLAQAPQKSRVRFVVAAGHVHNYERFFQNDIVYLVSGGGGAQPYVIERTPADLYQDKAFPNYHYVRIVAKGDSLDGTMIRVADPGAASPTWQEKDHFEITPVVRAAAAAK